MLLQPWSHSKSQDIGEGLLQTSSSPSSTALRPRPATAATEPPGGGDNSIDSFQFQTVCQLGRPLQLEPFEGSSSRKILGLPMFPTFQGLDGHGHISARPVDCSEVCVETRS